MEDDQLKNRLRSFLSRVISVDKLSDEDELFTTGLMNSLFAMQLVLFVENEFHVHILDDELSLDNFKSIGSIARLVNRKRQQDRPIN